MLLPASRQITMKQKTSKLTIRIPTHLKESFKAYAAQENLYVQNLLIMMIEERLSGGAGDIASADKNFSLD